jgi:eukaryotic-like serine/threonine-protein kinase
MPLRIEPMAEPIPGYTLLERIGGGGFGEVWKATAPGGLHKAIKVIHGQIGLGDDPDSGRAAEQELKAMQRIQAIRHPYLLSLERYDVVDGRLLITMELADCNLWERFRICRNQGNPGIPRNELLNYLEEAAEVLDMMNNVHALQHLDIKPQNLFLVYNHVKVADFGLVKDLEGVRGTVTGGVTPVYAAPETFDGVITRYCDQYSLGIVYQELLTGVRPFNGSTIQQLLTQHIGSPPNLAPLPASDRPAIARSLAKKPQDRFPACIDMIRALRGVSESVTSAKMVPTHSPSPARSETPPSNWSNQSTLNPTDSMNNRIIPSKPVDTPITQFRAKPSSSESLQITYQPVAAPPELTGDGLLVPALIVGLGQTGLEVARHFRHLLMERHGGIENLPHIKLIGIDTDPDTLQAVSHPEDRQLLLADDLIPAKLNRSSHYLKPRKNGRSLIEGWFDQQLLYKIPRNPLTMGIRSLGRLAFCDHYPAISTGIKEALKSITQRDAISRSDEHLHLGLRTNRPRIYIVAHLGGGTGSGMVIDAAYTARHKLKQLGYQDAEVIGILVAPPSDRCMLRGHALSNAYASLREIHHFSKDDITFTANYDEKDGQVRDRSSPFTKWYLFSEPVDDKSSPARPLVHRKLTLQRAVDFLHRDLLTPLGRKRDETRDLNVESENEGTYRLFHFRAFTWPQQKIIASATKILTQDILSRWVLLDPGLIRPRVAETLETIWNQSSCSPEAIIETLRNQIEQRLGQNIEQMAKGDADPLLPRGWFGKSIDAGKVWPILAKFQHIVGMPDERSMQRQIGQIEPWIIEITNQLGQDLAKHLAKLPVQLLEVPDFRLVGAEEGIDQLMVRLEQLSRQYQVLAVDLGNKATDVFYKIQRHLTSDSKKDRMSPSDLVEALWLYPKWRFESLLIRSAAAVYQKLKGHLGDLAREFDFCHKQMVDLISRIELAPPSVAMADMMELMPPHLPSAEQIAREIINQLDRNLFRDLELQIQKAVEKEFQSLLSVCVSSKNSLTNLQGIIETSARKLLLRNLGAPNLAELLESNFQGATQSIQIIRQAIDSLSKSTPAFGMSRAVDRTWVGMPNDDSRKELHRITHAAFRSSSYEIVDTEGELLICREISKLTITDLPQLGQLAETQYRQALESNSTPPHTRVDINEWVEVTA